MSVRKLRTISYLPRCRMIHRHWSPYAARCQTDDRDLPETPGGAECRECWDSESLRLKGPITWEELPERWGDVL
ncbi:hypothetical protein J6590_059256 [Homalodisca vitripennis]|nr:hypothetical protein J6590_059256 [Homalodisca vitripennis]